MADVVISADGLGKKYRLCHQRPERYVALRDVLARRLSAPLRALVTRTRNIVSSNASDTAGARCRDLPPNEDFWALKNVAFEVRRGEVIGIIGRNGAGKSTLLKILSRITEPTTGYVRIKGRVATLLEVGTGFHPELTGRENIFLNGAILGMTKAEVKRKFDEIVAFAEVEKFLDTPVKHYSSGMYVRLAFAVAAHLEPDILIVDEVLAVGDAEFQQKCLGKMQEVARTEGRTVLLVSHNMQAVRGLSHRALLLRGGELVCDAPTARCIDAYLQFQHQQTEEVWVPARTHVADKVLTFERVEARLSGEPECAGLTVQMTLLSRALHRPAFVAVDISDSSGAVLMQALPRVKGFIMCEKVEHELEVEIDLPPMIPGKYYISVWAGPHYTETFDIAKEIVAFELADSPTPGRTFPHTAEHGCIVPRSLAKLRTTVTTSLTAPAEEMRPC